MWYSISAGLVGCAYVVWLFVYFIPRLISHMQEMRRSRAKRQHCNSCGFYDIMPGGAAGQCVWGLASQDARRCRKSIHRLNSDVGLHLSLRQGWNDAMHNLMLAFAILTVTFVGVAGELAARGSSTGNPPEERIEEASTEAGGTTGLSGLGDLPLQTESQH